jgi:hypothetical protein
VSGTGLPYASFFVDQFNSSSFTDYAVQEYASRFRAVSPYVQDNWKVNSRLTLDLGLRWDYFPPVREVADNLSFFNPQITNPVSGQPGALQYAGTGTDTCNCDTPIDTYWKNIGPRIGVAFQSDSRTATEQRKYGLPQLHASRWPFHQSRHRHRVYHGEYGTNLTSTGSAVTSFCAANSGVCPGGSVGLQHKSSTLAIAEALPVCKP